MHRARQGCRFAGLVLATVCIVLLALSPVRGQLRPRPAALEGASAELIDRLRADPFTYFRFINRAWTERVCEAFAVRQSDRKNLKGQGTQASYDRDEATSWIGRCGRRRT